MVRFQKTFIFFALCIALLSGCGKVTQITSSESESQGFDLSSSLLINATELNPTASTLLKTGPFSLAQKTLYVTILGFQNQKTLQELSYGKAELKKVARGSTFTWNSTAYRKDGVELSASDHTWSKLDYIPEQSTWILDSKKVNKGFPLYWIAVYTDKNTYAFKLLEAKQTSGNKIVNLPAITPYDTFLTVLFLTHLDKAKDLQSSQKILQKLGQFYTLGIFQSLNYQCPTNNSSSFNLAQPTFQFNRKLETELIRIFEKALDNPQKTKLYVEKIPTSLLSENTKQLLIQKLSGPF